MSFLSLRKPTAHFDEYSRNRIIIRTLNCDKKIKLIVFYLKISTDRNIS